MDFLLKVLGRTITGVNFKTSITDKRAILTHLFRVIDDHTMILQFLHKRITGSAGVGTAMHPASLSAPYNRSFTRGSFPGFCTALPGVQWIPPWITVPQSFL